MKVAIIGSGNVGKALAGAATKAGHQVTLAASNPAHAEEAARATHARAARTSDEAVKDADLVVLAIPAATVEDLVDTLAPALEGKVIVDVTNRINTQNPGKVLDGMSNAESIQKKAPKARVVKAFNYAFASRMTDPEVDGTNLDAYIAGDDEDAKRKVEEFAGSIGFRPIDSGQLVMARALEAMALLLIFLQIRRNAPRPWRSGWKLVGPIGEGR